MNAQNRTVSSDRSSRVRTVNPIESDSVNESVSKQGSSKHGRGKSRSPKQRIGHVSTNVTDRPSDPSVINPNPVGASSYELDQLPNNQIPIAEVTASEKDHSSPSQTSNSNTEAVEGDESDSPISLSIIREAQEKDDNISVVVQCLAAGTFPAKPDLQNMPEESKVLFNQWDSLLIRDGVLCRR